MVDRVMIPGRYDLRPATNADADKVWMHISEVLQSYGIVADRGTTDADLVDLERGFAPDKGRFWVLLDGETLIGTVALRFFPEGRVELCRMYLKTEYRGRGLGRALLGQALTEARALGMRVVFLKTASVLTEALALYRSVGFAPACCGTPDGNCDTVMEMTL